MPVIAVSASLVERSLHTYVDTGFDAWILKPIAFDRLGKLMAAIVDNNVRNECLYQPGEWERGGWFHADPKNPDEVSTIPSGEPPQSGPSADAEEAAASEDPTAGDIKGGDIPEEQERLLQAQAEERRKEGRKGKHVHYATDDDESSTSAT